jgi:fumarate hydratase subunit beta
MGETIRLRTPLKEADVDKLRAGDKVLITGVILTGRDAAHKRLFDLIQAGKPLPVDIRGQIIYYVGPAPAKPGQPIGSAGPTTSGRMDAYSPKLMEIGLKGMIGKGMRKKEVVEAMKKYKAVYFAPRGAPEPFWPKPSRRRKWWPMRTSVRKPSTAWRSRIFR